MQWMLVHLNAYPLDGRREMLGLKIKSLAQKCLDRLFFNFSVLSYVHVQTYILSAVKRCISMRSFGGGIAAIFRPNEEKEMVSSSHCNSSLRGVNLLRATDQVSQMLCNVIFMVTDPAEMK